MKKLFNDDERWTSEAVDIAIEISNALEKIMKYYVDQDYSVRELSCIAHGCVTEAECKLVLRRV